MMTLIHRFLILATALHLVGCTLLQPGPSQNTAVVALVEKAESLAASGNLDQASASLERALRIEPRNPVLWQELASVRIDQGQYRQAENLAAKSNSLAGDYRWLRKKNWQIIAEARLKRGDNQGAQTALERAKRE